METITRNRIVSTVIVCTTLQICSGGCGHWESESSNWSDSGIDPNENTEGNTDSDLGTDTDTDTNTDTDTESSTEDPVRIKMTNDSFYNEGTNGFLYVLMRNIQGIGPNASIDAQFFNVTGNTIGGEWVDTLYEDHDIDTCSLYRLTGIGWEEESATITFLDAGDVSIHIDDFTLQMSKEDVTSGTTSPRYYLYDFPEGQDNLFGINVGVSATGADAPAIDQGTITIEVPPEYSILSPPASSILPREAIPIEWSGGDGLSVIQLDGTFFLKLNESEVGYEMQDLHELRCNIIDDGSFEIPAEIVALTPEGYWFKGSISKTVFKDWEITPGFVITTVGDATASFSYEMD